jgi:hypothetical protein
LSALSSQRAEELGVLTNGSTPCPCSIIEAVSLEAAMKFELWRSESESSYMLLLEGDAASDHVKPEDAKVVWTIEASTYEEALEKRNEFLGWGEYKRMEIPYDYPPKRG